ncbi:hypothetical protein NDU88_002496 [Pleurodeles waltl]|uniref:Integrase catalytic domain-containing protein n=1 Tax=Pleurodeles waltl TaxID=8319 RepID=A0AAV7M1S0_PLEWA|nr:hypothetical protein NDU88_002496 [Pleurodeles waltl]
MGMDLIGPIVPSTKGHTYILVMVDYATRYPEAIPLKSITTKTVAQAMINVFSRVGFPHEILTDQGTPFMSTLMKQVCKTLGISQIRTSVYHPQTDGLVERYNRTIKTLLRKVVEESGRDWDQKLPLVLYAIRTHEQASTGHSPFELVFGRQPRSLLDMAIEAWEEEAEEGGKPLLEYAHDLRSQLQGLWDTVRVNMEQAQQNQKQYYDRGSKLRVLLPGDQVLIMRPTSEHKLVAKWQGPHKVLRAVSPVTYLIEISTTPQKTQIYHINLLKKWEEPESSNSTEALGRFLCPNGRVQIEFCPTETTIEESLPTVNASLTKLEREQVQGDKVTPPTQGYGAQSMVRFMVFPLDEDEQKKQFK